MLTFWTDLLASPDPSGKSSEDFTVRELLKSLESDRSPVVEQVKAAIEELVPDKKGGLPDARRLGWKLRTLKDRNIAGFVLEQGGKGRLGQALHVRAATADIYTDSDDDAVPF